MSEVPNFGMLDEAGALPPAAQVIDLSKPAISNAFEANAHVGVSHTPDTLPVTGNSPWLPIGGGVLALTGLAFYALRRRELNNEINRDEQ